MDEDIQNNCIDAQSLFRFFKTEHIYKSNTVSIKTWSFGCVQERFAHGQ